MLWDAALTLPSSERGDELWTNLVGSHPSTGKRKDMPAIQPSRSSLAPTSRRHLCVMKAVKEATQTQMY